MLYAHRVINTQIQALTLDDHPADDIESQVPSKQSLEDHRANNVQINASKPLPLGVHLTDDIQSQVSSVRSLDDHRVNDVQTQAEKKSNEVKSKKKTQ